MVDHHHKTASLITLIGSLSKFYVCGKGDPGVVSPCVGRTPSTEAACARFCYRYVPALAVFFSLFLNFRQCGRIVRARFYLGGQVIGLK